MMLPLISLKKNKLNQKVTRKSTRLIMCPVLLLTNENVLVDMTTVQNTKVVAKNYNEPKLI